MITVYRIVLLASALDILIVVASRFDNGGYVLFTSHLRRFRRFDLTMNPSNANPDAVASHSNAVKSFYDDKNCNKKNRDKYRGKSVAFLSSVFVGKCEAIKTHVFDVTPGKNRFDVSPKTTRENAE
jgi:hypothetical protein